MFYLVFCLLHDETSPHSHRSFSLVEKSPCGVKPRKTAESEKGTVEKPAGNAVNDDAKLTLNRKLVGMEWNGILNSNKEAAEFWFPPTPRQNLRYKIAEKSSARKNIWKTTYEVTF